MFEEELNQMSNNELIGIIKAQKFEIKQLEKENIKQKEIIENLTTMAVCGDKKQIKNTAQYKLEQLENIIKEAIEYMKENCDIITIDKGWIIRSELTTTGLGKLFKILNKGGSK